MTNQEYTNHLANETSPYLLQHVNNPVDWYPWGNEALEKAKNENKPILLSIGYSSCHWCHVMAHESFEDEQVAAIMNEHFVNIKLDREERPDIDNIYMDAVQAMGLRGGWPLNVFLTADKKPFYGGTYFPKEQWISLLTSINDAYANKYDELTESADKFAARINESESAKYGLADAHELLSNEDFDSAYSVLESKFDTKWGGLDKAPKFPMPSIWQFLLEYSQANKNQAAQSHALFTLHKIVDGGIYDQVGGGFSRYSVDGEWHVPHFEKMLYDNGQLLSLYADAFKLTKDRRFLDVINGTVEWLEREMLHKNGGFYSALDADSEGEEGKFYVWNYEEIKELAGTDLSVLAEYYDVQKNGNWEEGKNVLRRLEQHETLAQELNLEPEKLTQIVSSYNQRALAIRNERVRPGLDDKIIAGWNGLVLSGLCKSYQATGSALIENLAQKNASFIADSLIKSGKLVRVYDKETEAFLEDYSAVIQSFILYYETFFDESYLKHAHELTDHVIEQFYDAEEQMFYYSSVESEDLIARKKELFDNVIPASNSIMAENLYRLGLMLDERKYTDIAMAMVAKVNKLIKQEPAYLSNWARVSLMTKNPTAEIIILGEKAFDLAHEINGYFENNKIIMAAKEKSVLPLFTYKNSPSQSTIYVCFEKVCKQPLFSSKAAIDEVRRQMD
ncbi:MAG: thioredoxin domain-containing protein [Cyclobacteriaceae bacterium]